MKTLEWLRFNGSIVTRHVLGDKWLVLRPVEKKPYLAVKKVDSFVKEDGIVFVRKGANVKILGDEEI